MTDELVKRLRIGWHDDDTPIWVSDAMTEAADRIEQLAVTIEALTAKVEQLGRELNMARYGQPDFAWSVHLAAMAELTAERERLALAICGGEDAPGYANAQTVETLEHVAKQNQQSHGEAINSLLAAEAERDRLRALLSEADRRIVWEANGFGSDFADQVQAALKGESHE